MARHFKEPVTAPRTWRLVRLAGELECSLFSLRCAIYALNPDWTGGETAMIRNYAMTKKYAQHHQNLSEGKKFYTVRDTEDDFKIVSVDYMTDAEAEAFKAATPNRFGWQLFQETKNVRQYYHWRNCYVLMTDETGWKPARTVDIIGTADRGGDTKGDVVSLYD